MATQNAASADLRLLKSAPKVTHEVARRAELAGLSASLLCRYLHVKIVFAKLLFADDKTMQRLLVSSKNMQRSFIKFCYQLANFRMLSPKKTSSRLVLL